MEPSFTQVTRQTNNKMGSWGEAGSACYTNRAQPPCSSFCPAPSPIPPLLCAQHTPPAPLPRLVAALVASSGRPSLDGQSLFSQLTGLISQLPKGNFPECGLALLLELDGHPANVTQIQLSDDKSLACVSILDTISGSQRNSSYLLLHCLFNNLFNKHLHRT